MHADVKVRWVAALRSGQYCPGTGYLRFGRGDREYFSALGVLLDVLDPAAWTPAPAAWAWQWRATATVAVPRAVQAQLGLTDRELDAVGTRGAESGSFPALADYIEQHF